MKRSSIADVRSGTAAPERGVASAETIKPIQRATLPQTIVKAIADLIRRGEWKLGDMIPSEKDLATMFGVGRSTIREALKSLSVMGVIESRAGEGSFLRQPPSEMLAGAMMWGVLLSERNLDDLLEVRLLIETECVSKAATLRKPDVPAKLYGITETMRLNAADHEKFMSADNEFHILIAAAASNMLYLNLASTIQNLVRVWYSATYHIPGTMDFTLTEHFNIARAIEVQDAEAAKIAMKAHLTQAADRLKTALA